MLADAALRIEQLSRLKQLLALITLIAVGTIGLAMGTGSLDVSVGEEALTRLAVLLLGGFLDDVAVLQEL